jgi:hypothetical protein
VFNSNLLTLDKRNIMKRSVFIVFVIVLAATISCSLAQNGKNKKSATITFKETEHDFGNVEQDGNCVYQFEFKNTGKAPLIIQNVQTSCGCTVPEWSNEPIGKNKSGFIKVKYNAHVAGNFSKAINVYSNATDSVVGLKIRGVVIEKKAAAAEKK